MTRSVWQLNFRYNIQPDYRRTDYDFRKHCDVRQLSGEIISKSECNTTDKVSSCRDLSCKIILLNAPSKQKRQSSFLILITYGQCVYDTDLWCLHYVNIQFYLALPQKTLTSIERSARPGPQWMQFTAFPYTPYTRLYIGERWKGMKRVVRGDGKRIPRERFHKFLLNMSHPA